MQINLANPGGVCAGVDRAIEIVNLALEVFGPPIYVRHEVVHNKFVVEDLRARGAIFVEELDQVPNDVIVIFSAHGVSQAVRQEAAGPRLKVLDATCSHLPTLHALHVHRSVFASLAGLIPAEALVVAESGVRGVDDVTHYAASGANAILVGEALVSHSTPRERIAEFTAAGAAAIAARG